MTMLLDTHTFLWFVLGDSQLSATARTLIEALENDILVSPASYWEIAIKVRLGKLNLRSSYDDFMHRGIVGRIGPRERKRPVSDSSRAEQRVVAPTSTTLVATPVSVLLRPRPPCVAGEQVFEARAQPWHASHDPGQLVWPVKKSPRRTPAPDFFTGRTRRQGSR
jgi:hypothetical protein